MFVNTTNLPDPIVKAVASDTRDVSASNFSVTELLQPPRQLMLQRRLRDRIVEDVADQKDTLLGTAVDYYIRQHTEYPWEAGERKYIQIEVDAEMYVISGEFDLYNHEDGTLVDIKVPGTYEYDHPSHEKWLQLVMYKYILEAHGYTVNRIANGLIMKDWSKTKHAYSKDYAPHPIVMKWWDEIPSNEWVESYLADRIRAHRDATDDTLCSDEETWSSITWAVMKEDGSKAMNGGIFDTEDAAIGFASTLEDPMKHDIQFRQGEPRRCKFYCNVGAMGFCEQWNGVR